MKRKKIRVFDVTLAVIMTLLSLIFFCIYDDKKVNKYIEEHSNKKG